MLTILALLAASAPALRTPDAECRALAAVARAKFGFDRFTAPPLKRGGDYLPACDWAALGIRIAPAPAVPRGAKLVFYRPVIGRRSAKVSVLVIQGKTSGGRYECALRRVARDWEIRSCLRRIAL